jgi:hypothetical protein
MCREFLKMCECDKYALARRNVPVSVHSQAVPTVTKLFTKTAICACLPVAEVALVTDAEGKERDATGGDAAKE